MARLNLHIPDTTMVALRQELAREREYRGRKYSMNDLCVSKLSGNGVQVRHTTESVADMTRSGQFVIPRVPPPPPVPIIAKIPTMMPWQGREEPQPERQVRAKEPELVVVTEELAAEIAAVDAEAEAVTRMADEGGPDDVG